MKKILIIQVLILTLSCAENKNLNQTNTSINQSDISNKLKIIEGEVLEINQGKDGYTAKLKSDNGEIYYITISRTNLKNPTQYKTISIGEKIKVAGDFWEMENKYQITVREIL